jgi:hypothetical protein
MACKEVTNVSEELAVSIFRVEECKEMRMGLHGLQLS